MLVILENYQISFNFSLIIETLHRTKTIYFSCVLHIMHCLNMHSCILFSKNYELCSSCTLLIICLCINNFLLTGTTLHFPHITEFNLIYLFKYHPVCKMFIPCFQLELNCFPYVLNIGVTTFTMYKTAFYFNYELLDVKNNILFSLYQL